MSADADDLRSTLEGAFEDATEQEGRPTTDATESVRPAAEAEPATSTTPEAVDRGDGRDVRGKFAKKAGEPEPASAPKDAAAPLEQAAPVAPADQYAKAPASWKPGAREAWGQLPPDVRAEVHRREREATQVMQETHQSRQVHEYVGQLAQQFAPALQAEGVDILTATQNLMNLSSRLRFGSPHEKAVIAAQIVRNYGVDVNTLADALDAAQAAAQLPGAQQRQQPQMLQDPRVDQLLAELNQAKQARAETLANKAANDVDTFGADKEFFADVRGEMADLLEVAAKRGVDLSLAQAYERACSIHPEISKVLAARSAAANAGTGRQSTQRSRHAASSVRGTPSGESTSVPTDLRSEIEAAIEQVGGR